MESIERRGILSRVISSTLDGFPERTAREAREVANAFVEGDDAVGYVTSVNNRFYIGKDEWKGSSPPCKGGRPFEV